MALVAISAGERGTFGLRSWVEPEPVTAQVINTSRFIFSGILTSLDISREPCPGNATSGKLKSDTLSVI